MNIFDALGKTVFDIMKPNFGCPATWIPSKNGPQVNATVLYSNPTEKLDISEQDYTLERFKMEYYEADLPGLFEGVQEARHERVTIEVSRGVFLDFVVKRCEKKGDGKTVIAYLTQINL